MDKIINTRLLFNPANWLAIFVIFTMWAFALHFAEKQLNKTST